MAIEAERMSNLIVEEVIKILINIYSHFSVPDYFMSDNVPYNSYKFKEFAKEWNFNVITSSPRYPQSNGFAEKAVAIVKRIIKKLYEENNSPDIETGLMEYRNTPLPQLGLSPSQLLMNRILKSRIPVNEKLLMPKLIDPNVIIEKLESHRSVQKTKFDENAKKLNPFVEGESVVIREGKTWTPGIIKNKYNNRSYIVTNEKGDNLRRNRIFLKPSNNKFKINSDVPLEYDSYFRVNNNNKNSINNNLNPGENNNLNSSNNINNNNTNSGEIVTNSSNR